MTTTTRRRWSPVTEATLQAEFEDAHDDYIYRPRWPRGWFLWHTARSLRDIRVIRATEDTTQ
jgi:hypothetical protein